jgi:hypothetical protein
VAGARTHGAGGHARDCGSDEYGEDAFGATVKSVRPQTEYGCAVVTFPSKQGRMKSARTDNDRLSNRGRKLVRKQVRPARLLLSLSARAARSSETGDTRTNSRKGRGSQRGSGWRGM